MHAAELIQLAESYLLSRPTCRHYAVQIRSRLRLLAESIGDSELTADGINAYLASLETRNLQPETIRGHRTSILSVLRFANWNPNGQIRLVKVRQKEVDCFLLGEIRAMVTAGEKMLGVLPNGVPESLLWPLAIDSGYETALRYGDMMRVESRSIADDGTARVTQNKTGKIIDVRFSPEAVALIRWHGHDLAIPYPFGCNQFRLDFRAIMMAASVRRGCWKMLRASAGSYREMKEPGTGQRLLGNTRAVFERHYNAVERLRPGAISPPRLRLPWWRRLFRLGA